MDRRGFTESLMAGMAALVLPGLSAKSAKQRSHVWLRMEPQPPPMAVKCRINRRLNNWEGESIREIDDKYYWCGSYIKRRRKSDGAINLCRAMYGAGQQRYSLYEDEIEKRGLDKSKLLRENGLYYEQGEPYWVVPPCEYTDKINYQGEDLLVSRICIVNTEDITLSKLIEQGYGAIENLCNELHCKPDDLADMWVWQLDVVPNTPENIDGMERNKKYNLEYIESQDKRDMEVFEESKKYDWLHKNKTPYDYLERGEV